MWLETLMQEAAQLNWVALAVTVAALVVGWVILRFVLRLTMKIFAIGCLGLLVVAGIAFVAVYWG